MPTLEEKIRKRLDKEFGSKIYKKDFTLGIRIPFNKVSEIRDTDIPSLKETVLDIGFERIRNYTVTTLLVSNKESVEFETETLLRAIENDTIEPIHTALVTSGKRKIQRIDERIRKLISESTMKASSTVTTTGSGGAKLEETYKLGGRGRVVGYTKAREDVSFGDVAVVPTIREAVSQGSFHDSFGSKKINVKRDHLQENIYRSRTKLYQLLVVDTTYLPDETRKIRTLEQICRTVLTVSYEKRSHVGILSFSGDEAELKLPFTTEVSEGEEILKDLDYGGLSPLPSALKKGLTLLERARGSRTDVVLTMILITRGKANVPLYPGGYLRRELMELSEMIRQSMINAIIVNLGGDASDTLLKEIAHRARARYYEPPLLGEKIKDAKEVLESIKSGEQEDLVEAGKRFLEEDK